MIAFITTVVTDPSDREFMLKLYEDFHNMMYHTVQKYISNPSDREDVVQTAVVRLIEKIGILRTFERCTLAGYIVSTVRNTSINHLKAKERENRRLKTTEDGDIDILPDHAYSLQSLAAFVEDKVQVSAMWDMLSDEERFLLEGKYIFDYTDRELAAQLGCKPNSIRMKLTRARRVAVKKLADNKKGDTNE